MADEKTVSTSEAGKTMGGAHQPGEATFKAVLAEDINWQPFAAFPASVRLAVIVGHPSDSGPYTIRVRVPHGVILQPHMHPEDRVYTVIPASSISGWAIGSTPINCRPTPLEALSCCPAAPPISIGRNPASTSRK